MTSVEIPIHFDVQVDLGATGQATAILMEELRLAGKDIGRHVTERVKDIIEKRDIYNEGHLYNSITTATEIVGSIVQVLVGTDLKYGKYKEYGTIPHFVPFHMARSLYNQAKNEWGWTEPPKASQSKDSGRLYLVPKAGGKPIWGVFVSGKAEPFLYPGWVESIGYIEQRLSEAGQRAGAKMGGVREAKNG